MTKEELDELRQKIAMLRAQLHPIEEKEQALKAARLEYCNEIGRNAAGKYFRHTNCDEYFYVKSVNFPKDAWCWKVKGIEVTIYDSFVDKYKFNRECICLESCVETTREEFEKAERLYEYYKVAKEQFVMDFNDKMKELGLKTE